MYLGDLVAGFVLDFLFDTKDQTGAGVTLSGSPAVHVYKTGSTVEVNTGVTLTVDVDSRTGLHRLVIDTADSFYEAGKDFTAVLTSGTVNGVNVAPTVLARFSIASRYNGALTAGDIRAAVGLASANLDTQLGTIDTVVDAVKAKTDNLPSDPADASDIAASFSTLTGKVDTVDTVVDAIQAKTDNLPSDPADQSLIIAAADAIVADTEDIQSRLPAALVGGRMDSNVQAMADGVITAAKIADAALTAAKFASGAFDAIWSVATRLLTAGTNIVLAKGTGVTGFTDLDAAGVRGAVGLASANLDTQLGTIDTVVDAVQAKTDNLPASPASTGDIPTANQNADALLDRSDAVETGLTPRGALRLASAALGGKVSGADTNAPVFRNAVADSKDRITATTDENGNRTAVTTDLT